MRVFVAEVQGALSVEEVTVSAIRAQSCIECPSAKSFLLSRPAGVYTCVRVKGLAKASLELSTVLVEWPFHLQRLSNNIVAINTKCNQDTFMLDKLKVVTTLLATTVLSQWVTLDTEDGMLSVLWYPLFDSADYGVAVHICPMPTPTCLASTILVHGEARANARCKHTQWIKDREPLEKYAAQLAETQGESIHEVVLSQSGPENDRILLEGLVTNFFVVKGGTVYTADKDVLQGSTREMVLKACIDLEIPVALEAPKLSERQQWQAAFVTSVVRVVIDVTCILFEEGEGKKKSLRTTFIPSDTSDFTRRIRKQIGH